MHWKLESNWRPKVNRKTRRPRNNAIYRKLMDFIKRGAREVDLEFAYRDTIDFDSKAYTPKGG